MRIGKEIALEIRKNKIDICDEFYQIMMSFSQYSQLASMYFKGSDWSMENDFPGIELLRKHQGGLRTCGMMTDVSGTFSNQRYFAVLGQSDVCLNYSNFSVSQLIIRHNSKATIVAKDYGNVQINILDNAEINIDCQDNAKVTVFDYGQKTKIISKGNVKIVESKWEK